MDTTHCGTEARDGWPVSQESGHAPGVMPNWRARLPVLGTAGVSLRALQSGDAAALVGMMTTVEVARFISPPPPTLDGFARFIDWSEQQRTDGRYVCFGIVPQGSDSAVGLIQIKALGYSFTIAEWGFALASPFWGTGLFQESARMVVDFAMDALGVHRLEARASVVNGRGNSALRKLGAVEEGLLRQSFHRGDQYSDQVLWSIVREEWLQAKTVWGARIH